ncbi:hypothetical protein S83_051173, partial [Arachis hypogaea]
KLLKLFPLSPITAEGRPSSFNHSLIQFDHSSSFYLPSQIRIAIFVRLCLRSPLLGLVPIANVVRQERNKNMAEPAALSSSKPSLMLAGKYDVEVEEVLDQILTSATCTVTNFTHTILFKSQSQSNLSNTLQYLNHHSHSIFFIVDCNRHTSAACTIIGLACAYNLQISISVSMSLYPLLIVLDLGFDLQFL